MEFIENIINLFLHLDKNLLSVIQTYGTLTYAILFFIIFLETGLVVTPFLPGDSLLFVAGTIAATNLFNIQWLILILVAAAILGDTVNYWIGHHLGPKVFKRENARFLKKEYLEKTREFYVKHGGKTIILARFVPIIRTFAPFVAGIGRMHYWQFLSYNIFGGLLWVFLFTLGGYWFGNLPFVKKNFHLVIFIIIFVSLLPTFIEIIKHQLNKKVPKEKIPTKEYQRIEQTFKKQRLVD